MGLLKDMLVKSAEIVEKSVDIMVAPLEQMAATLGLPSPPKPPKMSQLLQQLPEPRLQLPRLQMPSFNVAPRPRVQPQPPRSAAEVTMVQPPTNVQTPAKEMKSTEELAIV